MDADEATAAKLTNRRREGNGIERWRKQPSSGKHQNRKIYLDVGHVNPRDATGPSLLMQAMLVGMGRQYLLAKRGNAIHMLGGTMDVLLKSQQYAAS